MGERFFDNKVQLLERVYGLEPIQLSTELQEAVLEEIAKQA